MAAPPCLFLASDKYPAHLKAKGYNAFFLNACSNTWVRNVSWW